MRNAAISDETRSVPWTTRLQLSVRAGGRCEFHGCNKPLFEHHVTLADATTEYDMRLASSQSSWIGWPSYS